MALLRVPAVPGSHTDITSLGSCSSASHKLFLRRPTPICNRSHQLAIASVADVRRDSRQEPTLSPERSAGSRKKQIPPWRTSWTPIRRRSNKHLPTRDWSNQHQDLHRRARQRQGKRLHDDTQEEEGDRVESSPNAYAPQRTAMARIIERLRDIEKTLQPTESDDLNQDRPPPSEQSADIESSRPLRAWPIRKAGELILPRPDQNLFSIGNYWSTPDHPIPAPGRGVLETKFPWEFEEYSKDDEEEENKRVKPPTLAELIIPPQQLRNLRTAGIALDKTIKIGRLGITDNIADKIIGQWRSSELVKIKCGGPAATNMMKIHKDLERKTGGLVIWRSGSVAIVYRGNDYDMINNVGTSLATKLDGFLASEQTSKSFSKNVEHVQANKRSPADVIARAPVLGGNVEIAEVQANTVQNGIKEDVMLVGNPSNDIAVGVMPAIANEVKHTLGHDVDAHLGLQPMQTGISEGNLLRTNKEVTNIPQRPRPRPNVYPDPFVDRDYEIEIDSILETLGPRCKEWIGATPVPVDADLLPPEIPDYRPPYRLLPYGVRPQLTNIEQTDLRRLVRHITPHFVLGRNKGHQGLAAAILKLWEKSEVVKIAIKAGVQNTSSEKMAEELKKWTGGVLLGRDRYYITIYRGKDFLPRQIAFALTERTTFLRNLKADDESSEGGISTINPRPELSAYELRQNAEQERIQKLEAEKAERIALAKELEEKLALAVEKKHKAERDLGMLEAMSTPVDQPVETESLTEEEKYMYRKLGLKMEPFLLVGRRGVFDGVIENMHLHWKYRELVKLIVKERDPVQLQKIARMLEYESGGVLIAVVSTSKGQAIIVYRGKNYQRPENLRPQNLLNKKKALERSLEIQRRASLTRHISALEQEITKLKASLSDSERARDEFLDTALDELSRLPSDTQKGKDCEADIGGSTGDFSEGENFIQRVYADKQELLNLVKLGPIFRATRLSNLERLKLRKLALKLAVGSRFSVGKSNGLVGLARHIRIHFLKHSLVVVGMKHKGQGTSTQDLVHELEDLTGGVLVSLEPNEVIMYRGWQKGEKMPASGSVWNLSPELLAALEAEEEDEIMVYDGVNRRDLSDSCDSDDDEDHLSKLLSNVAETDVERPEFMEGSGAEQIVEV